MRVKKIKTSEAVKVVGDRGVSVASNTSGGREAPVVSPIKPGVLKFLKLDCFQASKTLILSMIFA